MLNKWRRLFHSSRVKLPSVTMSASGCLVSRYRIWILESRSILSTDQSKATLWVLDACLIVGLRPLIIIFNHGFIVLKDIQHSIGTRMCSAWWNVINIGQIEIGVCSWNLLRFCDWGVADRFPRGSLTSLVVLVWFGEEWNTSITKSQRSRAGIPSMRKLASRELISASVELCETEVCFLHIQLIGTNVWLPKMQRIPPDFDFESSRSPAKSESWNNPHLQCCAVFPTQQFCLCSHVCWM